MRSHHQSAIITNAAQTTSQWSHHQTMALQRPSLPTEHTRNDPQKTLAILVKHIVPRDQSTSPEDLICEVKFPLRYWPLETSANEQVCDAYTCGHRDVHFKAWKHKNREWRMEPYCINFERMEQQNEATGRLRKVKMSARYQLIA